MGTERREERKNREGRECEDVFQRGMKGGDGEKRGKEE